MVCPPVMANSIPASAQAPALDAQALAALTRMGAYLRTLKVFQVKAVTTSEDVLDDGQKVLSAGTADVLAEAPNHLRAEVISDRQHRRFFYDGKSFTLFAERVGPILCLDYSVTRRGQ